MIYAVSAIFQPCNGRPVAETHLKQKNQKKECCNTKEQYLSKTPKDTEPSDEGLKGEDLARRLTHAVLKALEIKRKSSGVTATSEYAVNRDDEITINNTDVLDNEYVSMEAMDTATLSNEKLQHFPRDLSPIVLSVK